MIVQLSGFTGVFFEGAEYGPYFRLTTAWKQEVEQRMEQLPRKKFCGCKEQARVRQSGEICGLRLLRYEKRAMGGNDNDLTR
jgi:hypothetical protein